MIENQKDKRAAIVCSHISRCGHPILRGVRTEPLEPEDSGWQFLCNSGQEESDTEAKIWLIDEVLKFDPSLSTLIHAPVGSKFSRKDKNSKWIEEK